MAIEETTQQDPFKIANEQIAMEEANLAENASDVDSMIVKGNQDLIAEKEESNNWIDALLNDKDKPKYTWTDKLQTKEEFGWFGNYDDYKKEFYQSLIEEKVIKTAQDDFHHFQSVKDRAISGDEAYTDIEFSDIFGNYSGEYMSKRIRGKASDYELENKPNIRKENGFDYYTAGNTYYSTRPSITRLGGGKVKINATGEIRDINKADEDKILQREKVAFYKHFSNPETKRRLKQAGLSDDEIKDYIAVAMATKIDKEKQPKEDASNAHYSSKDNTITYGKGTGKHYVAHELAHSGFDSRLGLLAVNILNDYTTGNPSSYADYYTKPTELYANIYDLRNKIFEIQGKNIGDVITKEDIKRVDFYENMQELLKTYTAEGLSKVMNIIADAGDAIQKNDDTRLA